MATASLMLSLPGDRNPAWGQKLCLSEKLD